jgi:propanol-preferring alcohol dehydrogenase
VVAFTREGDTAAEELARSRGAVIDPRADLDAAIIFAPAGELVPAALSRVVKGGTVVCAGIHMSDLPSFPYSLLWGERTLRSVANLTRQDGLDFFERLKTLRIETRRTLYPLERANEALDSLRSGTLTGTAVLTLSSWDPEGVAR